MIAGKVRRTALIVLAGLTLSSCAQSVLRISPDFGNAVNQDAVAQITDPEARYEGTPAPGSNGARVGLAQKRYETNTVIQPSGVTASSSASIGNADNGSTGGGGAGASAGMAK